MDGPGWRRVQQEIRAADRAIERWGRRPRYSDTTIVAMYLWSVAHDRPLRWACDRGHYGGCFRPRRLPSYSQFCKRIRTPRCEAILQRMHERLSRIEVMSSLSFLDGRAMRVGPYTKDRDATRGRAPGGMARGYKLHAWSTPDGRIPIWSVMPLNVSEKTVAGELLRYQLAEGVILADGNYDAGWLYDRVAADGGQLLTPLPANVGGGHRAQSSARLVAARAWDAGVEFVYSQRLTIERTFSHSSSYGGGLGPLPAWVRTLPRVRRWIGAKLVLYHVRLSLRKEVA